MSFSSLLNLEMDRYTTTTSADAYGAQSLVRTLASSLIPCRIRQLSMTEREVLLREGVDSTHKIYCDASIVVNATDEIDISSLSYQVVSVSNVNSVNHHNEIIARRMA